MTFFKKTKNKNLLKSSKTPFYKKRGWRITFLVIGLFIIFAVSFLAYAFSIGSKIFENGIGGKQIWKTIYGKEQLRGESEDRINILFLGMGGEKHPGGMLADSILLLSIKPKEKKAAMVSIPRDLLVKIPGDGEDKINTAFATGYNNYITKNCNKKKDCREQGMAAGANLTSEAVTTVVGVPIHYYVTADFNGFEKIIDQLGGVDIYVDRAIYDPLFPDKNMKGYEPFKISAGMQHMNGSVALKYARSRETTSDFDRAARQQKVIAAVKDKSMAKGFLSNPQKLIDVSTTLGNSVRTNFTISEIKTFAELVKDINSDQIISKVLSTAPDGFLVDYNNGTYYTKPKGGNFKEVHNYVQNIFQTEKVIKPARIEILNGTNTSGLATKLADQLGDDRFDIITVGNANTKTARTIIYDYTGGYQKEALEFLKSGLNAEVKTVSDSTKKVDISVLLGDDYTGFSKKLNT